MKTISFVFLVLAVLCAGCKNNPVFPSETQVVLQGYLYASEPVRDISLASSFAIGSSDSTQTPISNASVTLIKNSTRYQLSPNGAQPGYYQYGGSDLSVNTGDDFRIEVDYDGQVITAETIVPPKPEQLALSVNTLRFQTDSVQSRFGARTRINGLDTALVTWSNPAGEYYYVVIESIDPNRQLIRPDTLFTRRFVSEPTNQAVYRINDNTILYTGRHVLRLYHVNKEYADLFRSRVQDSRALNEPLTNVNNGLGIFSAFASDSLFFSVTLHLSR